MSFARFFRAILRGWHLPWVRIPLTIIAIVCICAAVWYGLPMTGVSWLISPFVRGGVIAAILAAIALFQFLGWRKRKRAAAALEESLIEEPVGDGVVLAERMQEALGRLKKVGGATYLYEMPWYVIIGPPGAGKTTALVHSGLEFPGTDAAAVAGFGGTKNCDFWFAEEAVMIDTAGRYTTQDSDARSDKMSWAAFLEQLKRTRPNQPINGVILAFSCEDMMTATDDMLDNHALAVRKRLGELNETLKINVPVYVIFTKADMIAGFREYFGPLQEDKRKAVWGITFQTKNRKEETHRAVAAEFDQLITRLNDEVTDRLNEEPDSVSRIAIFGFPGQMALMQRNVTDFLRRVFQKPQEINAILRGFYFTSGTQEGTPIDQVLGVVGNAGAGGAASGFMSGRGKSFFLHDLLKKVIFEERDWVGYDLKAMRRRAVFRTVVSTAIAIVCVSTMVAFGYSYWRNATLVAEADRARQFYEAESAQLQQEAIIESPATQPLLGALGLARDIPTGWGEPREQDFLETLGLSRRPSLRTAALEAYSDSLERLLRPRMMLYLEGRLPALLQENNIEEAYRALKVYILLAKEQDGREDDLAIQAYFANAWAAEYQEPGQDNSYREINEHLAAMLELDDRVEPTLKPNATLVETVQQQIATLSLAQQAYASILSDSAALEPYVLTETFDQVQWDVVFRTTDGRPLDTLTVPGLFTFTGYWSVFNEAVANAATRLEDERWVLGEAGAEADYQGQLLGLNRSLHALYEQDFENAWKDMLARIELVPMSAGAPQYQGLSVASSPTLSPILKLAEAMDRETRLTRFLDAVENIDLSPEAVASGDIGGQLAEVGFDEVERTSGKLERIFLNMFRDRAKFPERAGPQAGSSQRSQLEAIEEPFRRWHNFVADQGNAGAKPVTILLSGLDKLAKNRQLAARGGSGDLDRIGLQEALNDLQFGANTNPPKVIEFVEDIDQEFLSITVGEDMKELSRALQEEVAVYCTQNIGPNFPFSRGGSRHVATAAFGEFFGYGGRMERFYNERLRPHTQRAADGTIEPRDGSNIGSLLSRSTLSQFSRAERIRQAFFDPGSASPSVTFSIAQVAATERVEGSILSIGSRQVQLLNGLTGQQIVWPDQISDLAITLLPQRNGINNSIRFGAERWSIISFLEQRPKISGTRVDVTPQVGGRAVTLRLEFDSITVPFLMREIREFSCPTTLE
ncbi:MAG: type VI secretion system membrane subunit TssM [Pseudomonadota bacterium]